jgi:hypothetical protein
VIAVADSSALVILAEPGCLDFLDRVFSRVCIPNEVHFEVVSAGACLLGAQEVSQAECLEFKSIQRYLTEIARLTAAELWARERTEPKPCVHAGLIPRHSSSAPSPHARGPDLTRNGSLLEVILWCQARSRRVGAGISLSSEGELHYNCMICQGRGSHRQSC